MLKSIAFYVNIIKKKRGKAMNFEELNKRLGKDLINVYKTILINGEWGIGKSYYLDNQMPKLFNNCKIIKISLFGITSMQELNLYFIKELNNKLNFLYNKYLNGIAGKEIEIWGFTLPLPSYTSDIVKKLKKISKKEGNNIVVIIDDIERKSKNIDINELMGFFENISNIDDLKLILVANENEIEGNDKKVFDTFKEKVIEKTYNVHKYSKNALDEILEKEKENLVKNIDDEEKKSGIISTIKEFWKKYDIKNLRTLKKCINFIKQNNEYLNINDFTINQIQEIIIIEMAVCIEKISKDYLEIEASKESQSYFINSPFTSFLLKKYFLGVNFYQKGELVDSMSEIYDDIDSDKNISTINSHYKEQNNASDEEIDKIDNFYLSDKQLEERIEKFNKKYLNIVNNDLDINAWFKKFIYLYDCAENIGLQDLIDINSIEKTMDLYIAKLDISKGVRGILSPFLLTNIGNEEFGKYYYNILKNKITKGYYTKLIEIVKNDYKQVNYNLDNIGNLMNALVEKDLDEDVKELVKNELRENDYFIPNLNETLNEKSWAYAHKIWEMMKFVTDKSDFKEITEKLIEKASKSGEYRIKFLNKYYKLFE